MSAFRSLVGVTALAALLAGCGAAPAPARDIPANAVGVDLRLDKVP